MIWSTFRTVVPRFSLIISDMVLKYEYSLLGQDCQTCYDFLFRETDALALLIGSWVTGIR